MKHYCAAENLFLVRVARSHAKMVRAALTLIRFIQKQHVRMSVVRVAGSARTARRALIACLEGRAGDRNEPDTEVERQLKELRELQRLE